MAAIRLGGPTISVDEIAAHARVSKPVLYAEFGDKSGIAEAIALTRAEEAERSLIAQLAAKNSLDSSIAVRAAINSLIALVIDEPEIYGFIVRSVRASDQGILDNALVRTLHSRVGILTSVLVPGGDPALMSLLTHGTFGFVFAAVESWQATRVPSREIVVDNLTAFVLRGFSAIGAA
jgi:AcrR family transcriptional regulator